MLFAMRKMVSLLGAGSIRDKCSDRHGDFDYPCETMDIAISPDGIVYYSKAEIRRLVPDSEEDQLPLSPAP